eukprot:TRINITY_DN63030_c0_g1_i1.p1 TRINITY_DN63030_c0_g1~~TRINITY_DN63030_c0_g1_i1.p1  ORF type:complete len:377 (-),score=24.54 TRINITY_DN63030_c0_g1_i1:19-1149(-)
MDCVVCLEKMFKPKILVPCGHSCCDTCTGTLVRTTRLCPICKSKIQQHIDNWTMQSITEQVCADCNTLIPAGNPISDHQRVCPNVPTTCPVCGQQLLRRDLEKHIQSELAGHVMRLAAQLQEQKEELTQLKAARSTEKREGQIREARLQKDRNEWHQVAAKLQKEVQEQKEEFARLKVELGTKVVKLQEEAQEQKEQFTRLKVELVGLTKAQEQKEELARLKPENSTSVSEATLEELSTISDKDEVIHVPKRFVWYFTLTRGKARTVDLVSSEGLQFYLAVERNHKHNQQLEFWLYPKLSPIQEVTMKWKVETPWGCVCEWEYTFDNLDEGRGTDNLLRLKTGQKSVELTITIEEVNLRLANSPSEWSMYSKKKKK